MATQGAILSVSLLSGRREIIKHFHSLLIAIEILKYLQGNTYHQPTRKQFLMPHKYYPISRNCSPGGNAFPPLSLFPPASFPCSWCVIVKQWFVSIWKLSVSAEEIVLWDITDIAGWPTHLRATPSSPSWVWPHDKVLASESKQRMLFTHSQNHKVINWCYSSH